MITNIHFFAVIFLIKKNAIELPRSKSSLKPKGKRLNI